MTRPLLLLLGSLGLSLAQIVEQGPEISGSGSDSGSSGYLPPVQSGAVPSNDISSLPGSLSGGHGGWTRPSWPSQNSYGSTKYAGPDIQILPDNAASMTKPWAPSNSGHISSMTKPWTPYSSGPISSMNTPWTPYSSGPISSMTKPWSPQYQPSFKSSYQYPTAIRYPSTGGGCPLTKPAGGCSSRLTAPVYSRPPAWGPSSPCGSSPGSSSPCGSSPGPSSPCGSSTGSYGPIIRSLKPCGGSGWNPGRPVSGGSGWNPGQPVIGGSGWNPGQSVSWTSGLSWQKPVVSTNYISRGTKIQSSGASSDCGGGCGK